MLLDAPAPFSEAVKIMAQKKILPTTLDSAGIRELDANLRRASMFSAKTTNEYLLGKYQTLVESIINPATEQREDRVTEANPQGNVTTGYNPATARLAIKNFLQEIGYAPEADEAGTIKDLSSDARINLVVETNTELAQGAGRFIQMNDADVLDQFPAQELFRLEGRHKQRDWEDRWRTAAEASGDDDALNALESFGRMVALKSSPIWDSLGSSDLFDDALDNPYPPFAFNSGMWVRSVNRADAEDLGLIGAGDKAEPHPLDLSQLFSFAGN